MSTGQTVSIRDLGLGESAPALPARWARALLATRAGWSHTVLRLTLAVAIFPHGAQKLLGWFGGYGFEGTMGFMTMTLGIPYPLALLAVITEFFAPLALAAGFLSRLAAFGVGTIMVVAVATVHLPNGFFMNWSGAQAGEGFEYHILALGLALAVMIGGGGKASVDRVLGARGR
jgi:putative oxidoreductase